MKLYIRNMACESCKAVVFSALESLDLNPVKVELGEAEVKKQPDKEQKRKLNALIRKVGLELVEHKGSTVIEKIKQAAYEYVHASVPPKVNFSEYLSKKLGYEYNYLSNIFSDIEDTTIAHYLTLLKTEYAKELILFEDLPLREIASRLHYSSSSHFSAQFKKVTGLSPSHFKKVKQKRRYSIQELSGDK